MRGLIPRGLRGRRPRMYESDPGSWAPKDPAPEPDGCTAWPDAAERGGPEILRPAWHRRRRALGLPGPRE